MWSTRLPSPPQIIILLREALHCVVAAQAKIRINHGDLSALLYLQGYRAAEFVGG